MSCNCITNLLRDILLVVSVSSSMYAYIIFRDLAKKNSKLETEECESQTVLVERVSESHKDPDEFKRLFRF